MAKQASTQSFTEIKDIREDIVLFTNGTACLIIEAFATNFALLSQDEQNAQISAYSAFLNSLSFSTQILVLNKRVDITSYLTLLEGEIRKPSNKHVSAYLEQYKGFVQQLVKQNTVLDKNFYVVLPYSGYEGGTSHAMSPAIKLSPEDNFFMNARTALHTKADGMKAQLGRLNMQTRILEKDQIVDLFHALYNPESISNQSQQERSTP
ncbi:MAG: hypothetical protein KGJ07_06065 [Patescibacteria group bacterium]|nr:hypothetical protein [Patescibacteria group bacterium]